MPIITISRGSMSGGKALAECLADVLGYRCVAREVLHDAATTLGASVEAVTSKFETAPGLWSRFTHERQIYKLAVQAALAEFCAEGDLIYHGLAGQILLRNLPTVLRVRLISPLRKRAEKLARAHHRMGISSAEEILRDMDQERMRWIKLMYGVDVQDPALYDLTLNLEAISLDTACAIVAEVVVQPEYQITEDVSAELEAFAFECRKQLRLEIAKRS